MRMKKISLSLLLVFFFFFSSSSNAGDDDLSPLELQQRDRVLFLPGQSFNVSFAQYSGYITVDEESEKAFFYWFFEAEEDPESKPLALWLNGGPGCSSIAYGLVEEVGPFHVTAGGKGLYYNKYSWNQVANLLFLESPAGVGFSYSNNHSNDMLNNGDASAANENLIFLEKWFKRFPQFNGHDFYIIGESYAGHYIPQLAQAIVRSFELTGERWINLKGYLVGNALTDDLHDHQGAIEFLWSSGIISDQTYKLLHSACDYVSSMHPSPECERIFHTASEEIGNIDHYSIFVPTCTSSIASTRNKLLKRISMGKMSKEFDPCTGNYSRAYFNLPEVQDALHAKPSKWKTCSYTMRDNWKDSPVSVLPIVKELIDYGLRIWMYNGDVDAVVPVAATRSTINALQLPIVTPWHAWYDDGQVGGRTQVYKGLTFVTVRGAGHEVPLLKPKQALVLFKQFLSDSPMPTLSEHESS